MILKNNDAIDNGYLFSPDTITSTWGPYEHDVLWPLALGFTEEEIIRPEAEGGFGYARRGWKSFRAGTSTGDFRKFVPEVGGRK